MEHNSQSGELPLMTKIAAVVDIFISFIEAKIRYPSRHELTINR